MKKELKKKIGVFATAGIMSVSVTAYNAEIVNATEDKDIKNIEENQLQSKNVFSTKEEALKWILEEKEKLKNNYEITKEEIIALPDQIIGTEKIVVNESFNTEEEARKMKDKLEKNDIVSSNLKIEKKEQEVITINEEFFTKEEAQNFIENYMNKYGVKLNLEELFSEWELVENIHVATLSDLTKEQRNEKIESLRKEHEINSDTLKYILKVDPTEQIETVYIKDKITNEQESFKTKEEAQNFIKELLLKEDENITIEVKEPVLNNKLINSTTDKINKEFNTLEELNKYIDELEKNEYVLTEIRKEQKEQEENIKVPTGNVIVNDSTKLGSNNYYEVKANYIMLKQASGKVAIWTKNELTKQEQEAFKESWFNLNADGSVTENYQVYFIHGEGEKDLSYIGKQWKTYNITEKNGIIKMTCDKENISHLNYGTYEKEYQIEQQKTFKYILTGNKTKNTYEKEYVVDYKIVEKLYEDKITYGAIITKNKHERNVSYNVTGMYKNNEEVYLLNGEYEKNIRGNLYMALLDVKSKEDLNKEETTMEKPIKENQTLKDEKVNAVVKTGDNQNLAVPLGLATASVITVGALGFSRKRKRF